MRTWDDWQPDEWPTGRTERAWTPQTPCPFQDRGLTCPNGGKHPVPRVWRDCFLRFVLGEHYATNDGSPDAPPPPSLDVDTPRGGGGPRPARRAAREQATLVRAGLAGRAWAAVRAAFRFARDAALEAVADVLAGGTSRAVGGEVRARGDQAPPDTRTDPAVFDPGPTYGWGAGHTGRSWRRWL